MSTDEYQALYAERDRLKLAGGGPELDEFDRCHPEIAADQARDFAAMLAVEGDFGAAFMAEVYAEAERIRARRDKWDGASV